MDAEFLSLNDDSFRLSLTTIVWLKTEEIAKEYKKC